MGQPTETLADLLAPSLRVVCVGINPAPRSVEAGHYYQGRLGQTFFTRMRTAGLLPRGEAGWEDDLLFARGVGFTDIVKRPTRSEEEVQRAEYDHGRGVLATKLESVRPHFVIFTFKKSAEKLFGRKIPGNGLIRGLQVAGADVFVMPGPYEAAGVVNTRLGELRQIFSDGV